MAEALEYDGTTHTYRRAGRVVDHITGVLLDAGLVTFEGIPVKTLDRARDRGSAVHLATRYHDEGRLDRRTLHPEVEPYLFAYERFLLDTGAEVDREFLERPLLHAAFGYAGTPDRRMRIRGVWSTVEIKATYELDAATAIQTAAQAELFRVHGAPTLARRAIRLCGDGTYRLSPLYTDPSDLRVFLGALATVAWKRAHRNGGQAA